jgi:hypothetical protein
LYTFGLQACGRHPGLTNSFQSGSNQKIDTMDDFLYIIIGIIWVVYSLYANKQKQQKKRMLEEQRRQQQSGEVVQQEPSRPRSIIEQILDPEPEVITPEAEYYEEETSPQEAYSYETPDYNTPAPAYQSLESLAEEISVNYFENQYASRKEENYYDKKEMSESANYTGVKEQDELLEEFDLRKAVIYSEILNPRYI